MDAFGLLSATVSGGVVSLTWTTNQPNFGPFTAFAVQRKAFGYGDETFVTVSGGLAPTVATATDSPGTGDWTYRIAGTLVQGGVDGLGTPVYSNNVNVTTEAVTGAVTLTLKSEPSSDQPTYTEVDLSWTIAGTGVDVRRYEVQSTFDGGAHWKTIHTQDEFSSLAFSLQLPPGLGAVFFRVIADLPSATPPNNADVQSISNSVTVTT